MPTPMLGPLSRYGISNDTLRQAALVLQVGNGIADRIRNVEATSFIVKGEDWAEAQTDEFVATPLKPIRAPGQATLDPTQLTTRNYPHDFIQAATYHALGLLLHSEFFETAPNTSEAGKWALDEADRYIQNFKDKCTTQVGAGRRRHPNPHMPPNIAPRQPKQPGQP
jgi:hypothetical protein